MAKDYCPFCSRNANHSSLHKETLNSGEYDEMHWTKDYEIIKC